MEILISILIFVYALVSYHLIMKYTETIVLKLSYYTAYARKSNHYLPTTILVHNLYIQIAILCWVFFSAMVTGNLLAGRTILSDCISVFVMALINIRTLYKEYDSVHKIHTKVYEQYPELIDTVIDDNGLPAMSYLENFTIAKNIIEEGDE